MDKIITFTPLERYHRKMVIATENINSEGGSLRPRPLAHFLTGFTQSQLKNDLPDIRPGQTVCVYQKIKEKEKERVQAFEGMVIAVKHGKGINATFTVRKISSGIGVEKIFPLHSPNIEKIEILSSAKVRRAKLYFLRKNPKKLKIKK